MGNFASADLPELAILGVRVFIFPMVAAMWYNNRTNTGWAIALMYSFFWWILSVFFTMVDVFRTIFARDGLTATEEAAVIYFLVYPIAMFFSGLIGGLISSLMDIREVTPFYAIFPSFTTHSLEGLVSTICNPIDLAALREYWCMCERGLERWCFTFIDPPYWHTFIGFLLTLWTLTIPDIIFVRFALTRKWLAYLLPLGMKLIGYLVAWLYWSYWTDLYVWGPTAWNTAARRASVKKNPDTSLYVYDPNIDGFDTVLFEETQSTINKNVLVMSLVDIFGFLLVGGVIIIPAVPDVDIVIVVGISWLVLIFILFAFVAFFFWIRRASQPPLCPRRCPRLCPLVANGTALASTTTTVVATPTDMSKAIVPYTNKRPTRMDNIIDLHHL